MSTSDAASDSRSTNGYSAPLYVILRNTGENTSIRPDLDLILDAPRDGWFA